MANPEIHGKDTRDVAYELQHKTMRFQVVEQAVASNAFCRQKSENGAPAGCSVSLDGATSPYPFDREFFAGCAPCQRFFIHTDTPSFEQVVR